MPLVRPLSLFFIASAATYASVRCNRARQNYRKGCRKDFSVDPARSGKSKLETLDILNGIEYGEESG